MPSTISPVTAAAIQRMVALHARELQDRQRDWERHQAVCRGRGCYCYR